MYVFVLFPISFLAHQVSSLSQTLNDKIMAFSPAVDILDIICCSLEMTCCIIALGDEYIIVNTALQWLIERNWWPHELLLDSSETLKARCELKMVICVGLGYSGDNGNVVALGADTMGAGDDCNVDVYFCQYLFI